MHIASEYVTLGAREHDFIIQHLLPADGGALNIMGAPKIGKSYLALQLAEAITNPLRTHFLSYPVKQHGRVIYVQLDTSRQIWSTRIRNLWRRADAHLDFSRLWIIDKEDIPGFDLFHQRDFDWLTYTLRASEVNPLVVIFDVFRELYTGPENDNNLQRRVIGMLEDAVAPASLVLISHTRKPPSDRNAAEAEEETMDANRGSNYLNGRVDAMLKLTRHRIFIESRTDERAVLPVTHLPSGFFKVIGDSGSRPAR